MNTDTPYPPHTPPAPPEGMKWEYRGMGWSSSRCSFYVVHGDSSQASGELYETPKGLDNFHYFEAVPCEIAPFRPVRTPTYPDYPAENPKEQAGRQKCPLHLLPPEAMKQAAYAHQHGSKKYGRFNWRHAGINATTYIGAIRRHLDAWSDGEDNDPDSGLSHIAHIIAGANIVLDAQALGMMNDDRSKLPTPEEAADRMNRSVLREVTPGKPVPCEP